MDDMRELITWDQLAVGAAIAAAALGLGGLLVGLLSRAADGRARLTRALVGAVPGPALYGLWRLFAALTAYNPQTGQAGLHRVGTLGLCLLLFVVVGVAYGLLVGATWHHGGPTTEGTKGEATP